MPIFSDNLRVGASGAAADYTVDRSLRFNRSDSAYLTKSLGSTSNRRTFTYSFWVKRTVQDAEQCLIYNGHPSSTPYGEIRFEYQGSNIHEINWYSYDGSHQFQIRTNRVFRDPSAWYHIVLALDTTQATQSNRAKIYVNGIQETSFKTETYPSQNTDTGYNVSGNTHSIGGFRNTSNSFDGYVAEFNFIDGQQLTPSSFAETNSNTGQWVPKKYTGSYGTNGFYLNFSDNSGTTATTLGKDSSGNGNNFTPNNFSVSAGAGNDSVEDTPTNNFCTLNPLDKHGNVSTVQGNLQSNSTTGGSHFPIFSTMSMKGGKYYIEYECKNNDNGWNVQIMNIEHDGGSLNTDSTVGNNTSAVNKVGYGLLVGSGRIRHNTFLSSPGAYGSALAVSGAETGMCAVDLDNGKIWWGKEGTWFDSGNPANGTNAAFTGIDTSISWNFCFHVLNNNNVSVNFGQQGFTHTPPDGFEALCSANLPDPTIKLPNKHFGTIVYAGDGSASRTISDTSSVNFTPDWVWAKNRSQTDWHILSDAVRGFDGKTLYSNRTDDEYDASGSGENGYISAAANGGFVATDSDGSVGGNLNANSENYVAWNWNGGGSTASNSDGSITSSVRANATAGFSIVSYTGTGADATVGHGLGVTPSAIIVKNRDRNVEWIVKHKSLTSGNILYLNLTAAADGATGSNNGIIADLSSSSTFSITRTSNSGNYNNVGVNGEKYIAYCFSEVAGYSKFGTYVGNGSSNGTVVHLGFRPALVIFKNITSNEAWSMFDNKRDPDNPVEKFLRPSGSNADTSGSNDIDFLSDGFKTRTTNNPNTSGARYIFLAFAEYPSKYSRAR